MSTHFDAQSPDIRLILDILATARAPLSQADIGKRLAVDGVVLARSALSERLSDLKKNKKIEMVSAGRSARYQRRTADVWFDTPVAKRQVVHYEPERISKYVPNQTTWLSHAQRKTLHAAQPTRHDVSSYARGVAEKLMVDLSYASSAMEGNTYNYIDTEVLIKYGQVAIGKSADETQMVLNHKQAVSYLIDTCHDETVSARTIREIHSLLSQDILDPRESGSFRMRPVAIGGSSYLPLSVPTQIEEQLAAIIKTANAIEDPFEQSLFWLVSIPYLQPFVDVNKRTGRLLCNVPLLKNGLAPLSFMDMDRKQYVRGLLEFYELGSTEIISDAFVWGYSKSAHRYDAHLTKDPHDAAIDRKYKTELGRIVALWVVSVIEGASPTIETIVFDVVGNGDMDPRTQSILIKRAELFISSLNEGNRILYGVSPNDYTQYVKMLKPNIDSHSNKFKP